MRLNYSGTLKVSIAHGKKIIQTRTYKNQGTAKLFEFFCLCLAGQYDAAKNLRPMKLKLFNEQYENLPDPANISVNNPASNIITVNKPSTITKDTSVPIGTSGRDYNGYSLTLHYLIPFSYITETSVDQACLYSSDPANNDDFLAYYLFEDENHQRLDPITINSENKLTYNLIVEWTLMIENQKKEN